MDFEKRRWLKIREAADYYSLHEKSLYRACAKKKVPCVKVPGIGLRIDKLRMEEMMERKEIQPEELGRIKERSSERKSKV